MREMPPAAGRGPKCLSGKASPGLPGSTSESPRPDPALLWGGLGPLGLRRTHSSLTTCSDRLVRGMSLRGDAQAAWKHHPDGLGEGDFVEPGAQQGRNLAAWSGFRGNFIGAHLGQ